jgi:hypothetical protein
MDQIETHFFIRAEWGRRSMSAEAVVHRFLQTLDGLLKIHPVFADWGVVDSARQRYLPLEPVRPLITALVEEGAIKSLGPTDPYAGRDGFCVEAKSLNPSRSQTFRVGLREGNYRGDVNCIALGARYVEPLDLALVTAAVFRPALRLLVETWRPANAIASSYAEGRGSATDLRTPHLRFHSPWMAYLPDRLLNKGGVPEGLLVEPVVQGAILATSFERPDLSQPDQADATAKLLRLLIERLGERRRR